VVELGEVIDSNTITGKNASAITITDLTGVAVQDLSIARAVFLSASAAS
jgi:ornithine cyclodeaminase/alanine dehydrogenase-like protein (mu-crystallin family)